MTGSAVKGRPLLVIGGGGHAAVVIDVARSSGFDPIAVLDGGKSESTCNGVEVVGDDSRAADYLRSGVSDAIVALGDNKLRWTIGTRLRKLGFDFPQLVHPSAIISPSARIGAGTVVMPLVVINAGTTIGAFAIINSAAIIEHDCMIGDGAHIAPGTVLGGCVTVGELGFVGIGSAARPRSVIGDRTIIGAGSTVIGNVQSDTVALGTPARSRSAL